MEQRENHHAADRANEIGGEDIRDADIPEDQMVADEPPIDEDVTA